MRAPAAAWATPSPNVQLIARRTPPCRWPKTDPSMGQCTDFHLARIRVPRGGASESPLAVSHQSRGKTCLSEASCSDFNAISASQTARQKNFLHAPGAAFYHYSPLSPTKAQRYPFLFTRQRGFSAFRHRAIGIRGRRSWRRADFRRKSRRKILFQEELPASLSPRRPTPKAFHTLRSSSPARTPRRPARGFPVQAAPRRDGPRST